MLTDIVGYTSLMERDEATAIQVRDRHRAIALRADGLMCGRSRYRGWGFALERRKGERQ